MDNNVLTLLNFAFLSTLFAYILWVIVFEWMIKGFKKLFHRHCFIAYSTINCFADNMHVLKIHKAKCTQCNKHIDVVIKIQSENHE